MIEAILALKNKLKPDAGTQKVRRWKLSILAVDGLALTEGNPYQLYWSLTEGLARIAGESWTEDLVLIEEVLRGSGLLLDKIVGYDPCPPQFSSLKAD